MPALPTLRQLERTARSLIIWCLLAAVPIYGLSGTIVELLGARHVHATPVLSAVAADTDDVMRGWQDFRRATAGMGHGHQHASDGSHEPAHDHSALERHHHDRADASVVALDGGPADAAHADEGGSATATHLLALSSVVLPAPAADDQGSWLAVTPPRVATRQPDALERPPRT